MTDTLTLTTEQLTTGDEIIATGRDGHKSKHKIVSLVPCQSHKGNRHVNGAQCYDRCTTWEVVKSWNRNLEREIVFTPMSKEESSGIAAFANAEPKREDSRRRKATASHAAVRFPVVVSHRESNTDQTPSHRSDGRL